MVQKSGVDRMECPDRCLERHYSEAATPVEHEKCTHIIGELWGGGYEAAMQVTKDGFRTVFTHEETCSEIKKWLFIAMQIVSGIKNRQFVFVYYMWGYSRSLFVCVNSCRVISCCTLFLGEDFQLEKLAVCFCTSNDTYKKSLFDAVSRFSSAKSDLI